MKTWKNDLINNGFGQIEIGNIWSINNNLALIADEIIEATKTIEYDCIAGIETKGLIIASALSARIQKPLLVLRKVGKIIYTKEKYQEEYINWKNQKDGLEIEKSLLSKNIRIIVVDDLSQTLETFKAAYRIINSCGSEICAYVCIANISNTTELYGKKIISLLE